MEETIQENIVLRRLLLSLRNSTEPNKENQSLLKQIDEQLKKEYCLNKPSTV